MKRAGNHDWTTNERDAARLALSDPIIATRLPRLEYPFGTEERDYFGWLPAEITRGVPESLINTIASMVCHAHRMGRKEAYDYLKQFVLKQMRVPEWPHYPMNDLRK